MPVLWSLLTHRSEGHTAKPVLMLHYSLEIYTHHTSQRRFIAFSILTNWTRRRNRGRNQVFLNPAWVGCNGGWCTLHRADLPDFYRKNTSAAILEDLGSSCFSLMTTCYFSLNRPHWANSVIESSCPSVCVFVCLCVCAIGCSFF